MEEISLDDSGSAPPSMAPPPLPPDYGSSQAMATPQSQGAWQTPAGNSFNSAGPALATASNNDDWDDPWGNNTPQQQQPQQQQQDWNADVSIQYAVIISGREIDQLTSDVHQVPPVVTPTSNDIMAKVVTVPMSPPHVSCPMM